MVTVVDYAVRQNADGQDFIALILEGDIELVQSQESGQYYATARRCSMNSTFNEVSAIALVGSQLPGLLIYCYPITGKSNTIIDFIAVLPIFLKAASNQY